MSDLNLFNTAGPQPGGGKSAFLSGQPQESNTRRYGSNAERPSLESALSKSWLFEIVDRETEDVIESFTLIMPPQSLTIKESQRTSITKTFGNAFIDDYGQDNIQITLKGISGTTHAFPTFTNATVSAFTDIASAINSADRASSNVDGFTGKNAFYEFRDKIMRYKGQPDWEKRELRVYDLADEQAYKCVLLDFTLDRTSDQPLRYPYTITLFVYEPLDALTRKKGKVIDISRDPISALDDADSLLDTITNLYQDVQEVLNMASLLRAKALELRTRYNNFLTQTTRIITSPLDIAKSMIDIALTATSTIYDTYRAGKYTLERYITSQELFREVLRQAMKLYGFQISRGWQQSNTVEVEGDDGIDASTGETERAVTIETYEYSALRVYTVKGQDTLQRIALDELGNSDLWQYIASINEGVSSNEDISAGDEIFLPLQVEPGEGVNKEQFILTEDFTRDPYGTDIKIDSDGNLIVQESNDVSLIAGIENVKQAINLRLNTLSGSMIKQSVYGIATQAGLAGSDLAIKYMKTAIRASLVQDPRIEKVENMIVTFDRDALKIGMSVKVIGINNTIPVTELLV